MEEDQTDYQELHQKSLVFKLIEIETQQPNKDQSQQENSQTPINNNNNDTDIQDLDDGKQQTRNFLKKDQTRNNSKLHQDFQIYQNLNHENLGKYIDLLEFKHQQNTYFSIQEYYFNNLESIITQKIQKIFSEAHIIETAFRILKVLDYLETNNCGLDYLSSYQIQYDKDDNIKIFDFMKNQSEKEQIPFDQNNILFHLPPEYFLTKKFSSNSSLWSLAIIILRMISLEKSDFFLKYQLEKEENILKKDRVSTYTDQNTEENQQNNRKTQNDLNFQFIKDLLQVSLKYKDQQLFQKFSYFEETNNLLEEFLSGQSFCRELSFELRDFLNKIVQIDPSHRISIKEALNHQIFNEIKEKDEKQEKTENTESKLFYFSKLLMHYKILNQLDPTLLEKVFDLKDLIYMIQDHLPDMICKQFLKKDKQHQYPHIMTEYPLQINKNQTHQYQIKDTQTIIQSHILYEYISKDLLYYCNFLINCKTAKQLLKIVLKNEQKNISQQSTNKLEKEFTEQQQQTQNPKQQSDSSSISTFNFFKKMLGQNSDNKSVASSKKSSNIGKSQEDIDQQEDQQQLPQKQPSLISDKLIDYLVYLRLLTFQPQPPPQDTQKILSIVPLPSHLRPLLWEKLLNIPRNYHHFYQYLSENYSQIYQNNKHQEYIQIENDIPRCHQYSLFSNSNFGKQSIYKTLKSFLNVDEKMVYIQGLDSMCFICLNTFNLQQDKACAALSEMAKKYLKILDTSQTPEEYIITEKITLFKLLLRLEEPQLALYLEEVNFIPEIYAISWFMNLFSMVFEVQFVQQIWDFNLCNENFTICFAVALMIELKDQLLIQDQNELMASIRNLEGIVDFQVCLKYAQYLSANIPKSFMEINYLKNKTEQDMTASLEVYQEKPWQVPLLISDFKKQECFSIEFSQIQKNVSPIFLDIRTVREYEDISINQSLFIHYANGKINDIVLDYLDAKSQKFFQFETVQQIYGDSISSNQSKKYSIYHKQDNIASCGKQNTSDKISIFFVLGNYERVQDIQKTVNILQERGIKRIAVIKGGIQSLQLEFPEFLRKRCKATPLNYFKRKQ